LDMNKFNMKSQDAPVMKEVETPSPSPLVDDEDDNDPDLAMFRDLVKS